MIIKKLNDTLSALGYPVLLQGSMSPETAYPDDFITWWNNETHDVRHFDNRRVGIVWDFDVNCYSSDPEKVYQMTDEVIDCLKRDGFQISGMGYTVASDEPTHTGRGLNVLYVER